TAARGLAEMKAPTGTVLIFATSPGNVARDGAGRNGIYTKHLLRYMQEPDLEIGFMLRKIRTAVREETRNQQVPWENSAIEGEFYFNGLTGPVVPNNSVPLHPTALPEAAHSPATRPQAGGPSPHKPPRRQRLPSPAGSSSLTCGDILIKMSMPMLGPLTTEERDFHQKNCRH